MTTVNITLTGTSALILNAPKTINPFHPLKLQMVPLTAKGSKMTEAEHNELNRLKFLAAIYHNDQLGPHIPVRNVKKSIMKAASAGARAGRKIENGVIIIGSTDAPLIYDGPRDLESLWDGGTSKFVDIRDAK